MLCAHIYGVIKCRCCYVSERPLIPIATTYDNTLKSFVFDVIFTNLFFSLSLCTQTMLNLLFIIREPHLLAVAATSFNELYERERKMAFIFNRASVSDIRKLLKARTNGRKRMECDSISIVFRDFCSRFLTF